MDPAGHLNRRSPDTCSSAVVDALRAVTPRQRLRKPAFPEEVLACMEVPDLVRGVFW